MTMVVLNINGSQHSVEVEADTPLLWVLRDELALTGTKFGCGLGLCGACTVLLNGRAVRSCVVPVSAVGEEPIVTIEGLSKDKSHPVQRAWIAENVPQCGYCQSGMILATVALLNNKPHPTDGEIDLAVTNLCRCGTYGRVRKAIHRAAEMQGNDDTAPKPTSV
jgi:aerobic-type carbon monoxide dehydrogenase small subunit (CoxS/CutS family)